MISRDVEVQEPASVQDVAPQFPLYRFLSQFEFLSYRLKIMVMAFLGTHIPLITLAVWFALHSQANPRAAYITIGVTLLATLGGTAFTLFVLDRLLAPVLATAESLRLYRDSRKPCVLPVEYSDDVGTLMSNTRSMIDTLEQNLTTLEFLDEGSGLPNRRRFIAMVESGAARGEEFSVVVIRLDNIARLAETVSLESAERASVALARRLEGMLDAGEQLARVGAGEYAFIRTSAVANVKKRGTHSLRLLIAQCAGEIKLPDFSVSPFLRAGVATFPHDSHSAAVLLDRAMAAAAQSAEGASVTVYSDEGRELARERFRLEEELRHAVERNELLLHYQPVVDARESRIIGAEALVRWNHPTRGLLPPGAFLPTAEEAGLLAPISLWVLTEACATLRKWEEAGHPELRLAINLSAEQFLNPRLIDQICDAAAVAGVSLERLELELTETAVVADMEYTSRAFASLRALGCTIAIDDFGTGYASMSRLLNLEFDRIKIDREFVTEVQHRRSAQAICRALIELSRGLALEVLVEGVESEDELNFLQAAGCRLFQGYFFSRPVPNAEFLAQVDMPVQTAVGSVR